MWRRGEQGGLLGPMPGKKPKRGPRGAKPSPSVLSQSDGEAYREAKTGDIPSNAPDGLTGASRTRLEGKTQGHEPRGSGETDPLALGERRYDDGRHAGEVFQGVLG